MACSISAVIILIAIAGASQTLALPLHDVFQECSLYGNSDVQAVNAFTVPINKSPIDQTLRYPHNMSLKDQTIIRARERLLMINAPKTLERCRKIHQDADFHHCMVENYWITAAQREFVQRYMWETLHRLDDFPGTPQQAYLTLVSATLLILVNFLGFLALLGILMTWVHDPKTINDDSLRVHSRYGSYNFNRCIRKEMLLAAIIAVVMMHTNAVVTTSAAPLRVQPVSPGVIGVHRAQASIHAGFVGANINSGINITNDLEFLREIPNQYHLICDKLRGTPGNCWERYQLVKASVIKTICFVKAFQPDQERVKRSISSFSVDEQPLTTASRHNNQLRNLSRPARDTPLEPLATLSKESIQDVDRHGTECFTGPRQLRQRSKREGFLKFIWKFLCTGFGDDADKANEYQHFFDSARISALALEVKKVEHQEEMWRDSTQRVIFGIDEMDKGFQKFSVNTINLMVAEEYNHVHSLVTAIERKYEMLGSELHLAATLHEMLPELKVSLPKGTEMLDIEPDKILEASEIDTNMNNHMMYVRLRIPIVYENRFDVLELVGVPNVTLNNIVDLNSKLLMVGEHSMKFAYITDDHIMTKAAHDHWIVNRTPLRSLGKENDDCVATTIMQRSATKSCTSKPLTKDYNEWVELQPNQWLFYTSRDDTNWYLCQDKREQIKERMGIINLQENCTIEALDVTIAPIFTTLEQRDIFIIPEKELFAAVTLQEIPVVNISTITLPILNSTTDLDALIANPSGTPTHPEGWLMRTWHYIVSLVAGIIGIAGLGTVLYCCYRFKTKTHKKSPTFHIHRYREPEVEIGQDIYELGAPATPPRRPRSPVAERPPTPKPKPATPPKPEILEPISRQIRNVARQVERINLNEKVNVTENPFNGVPANKISDL